MSVDDVETVSEFRDDLLAKLDAIEKKILQLEKETDGRAKNAKIKTLSKDFDAIQGTYDSFRVHMREMSKKDQAPFQADASTFQSRIGKVKTSITYVSSNVNRAALMDGGPSGSATRDPTQMTAGQIYRAASRTQEKDIAAVNRMRAVMAAMEGQGADINTALAHQTAQMNGIMTDLDNVESNLTRADRQLRAIARRVATDRILLFVLFLMACSIVGIIVYTIAVPNNNLNVNKDVVPKI